MSEKISYIVFFAVAIAIVSIAVYVERPESLASAIPGLVQDEGDDSESSADSTDGESDATTVDSEDSTDEKADTTDSEQEGPEGDGDGEANDDVNSTQSASETPDTDTNAEPDDEKD